MGNLSEICIAINKNRIQGQINVRDASQMLLEQALAIMLADLLACHLK